ncbi:MAG: DUF393 domain-containing protein, partial [Methylacidiphilales bacterium]|nr:DUF393 domain-containing protein [Candidatus Methylacidiphilales bacterium]
MTPPRQARAPTTSPPAPAAAPALTVYYDGSCPVCSREIAHYRRCEGADAIVWTDITKATGEALAPDLTRSAALARFHVRRADGSLVDGGRAFAEIWQALPRFRRAGRLFAGGAHTYYFGVGNMFEDLDTTVQARSLDRDAHIQRLGEMARVMTDAGLIFITTLTDVDDYDLQLLKEINAPNELLVVHVGENIYNQFPDRPASAQQRRHQ